jgi:HrpA-like RNA helicase
MQFILEQQQMQTASKYFNFKGKEANMDEQRERAMRETIQKREEEKTVEIFDKMAEDQFNSVAFFFREAPMAELNYLKFNEKPTQSTLKHEELLLDSLETTLKRLELDHDAYLSNFEQNSQSNNSYFHKKKINLEQIRDTYMEMRESKFRYTFLKYNNDRQFNSKLPIYAKKKEFLDKYKHYQVIVLKSSAGSGKSTQLPQYLLEVMSETGRAVITEPRAIAVESVANRVSAVHSN